MKIWKVALGLVLCLVLFAAVFAPVRAEAAEAVTVYLDPQGGNDTADGLTEATAVKDFNTAYAKVKEAGGGTIVFLSTLEITGEKRLPQAVSTVPVTLTSKTGAEGFTSNNNVRFMCPTTLENITVTMTDTGSSRSNRALCGEGKKLVIGENVTSVGTDGYYFCVHGGARWASCASTDVTIQSGTWRNVYVGTYGYSSGTAKVTGKAKLTMTGGTLTGFIAPSYANSATIGSMEISLSNMSVASIYCAPVTNGSVTGDVTLTLGEGAKVTSAVFTGSTGAGNVNGNVSVILDGADTSGYNKIAHGGGSEYTGTIGGATFTAKSGTLGVAPANFNTVTVDVPAGKTLTVSGVTVTANTAKAEGTVAFAGASTLDIKAVTGTLNCDVAEMAYNQNFVIAPAGSSVVFPAASGVTEEDGKWAARNLDQFKGLVVTVDAGITFNLYQGFATDTKIEPYLVEGNTRYYPNLEGKYRYVASRSGYIKVSKNIYMSPEEAQTRVEEHVSLVKREKAWDTEFVRRLTDEALAAFPNDRNQWPEFAEVFTTPAFAEGRQQHKYTTHTEMENFIANMDDQDDNMYIHSMGVTPTNPAFNMPLVIFSETDLSGAATLEEAAALIQANGKPTIQYYAQMHGNEQAAGEGAMGMIAMMDGEYGDQFLDSLNIYIIPRLNPDGAYQDLRRIPSQTLDPNRDFMNLETYEIQRQHYVYNLFQPEVFIDGHEYNVNLDSAGIAHKDIMISATRAPYATDELKEQSTNMALALFDNMRANSLSGGWYTDSVSGAGSNVGSTYIMQRGSLYYLLESYGIYGGTYNYERRVMAHVSAVDGILKYVDANAQAVNKAVNDQWQKLIDDGKVYGTQKIVLDATYRDVPELYLPGNKWVDLASGKLTDRTFPAEISDVILREREAPTAYLVPADHEKIDYILWHTDIHGISHYEIPAGASVMVQHVGGSTTEAVITEEMRTVFANGAYVFPMDQTSSRILAYLMEPDVTDNETYSSTYAMAGVFQLENGEYPVYRYVRNLNSDSKVDYELLPEAPQGLAGDAASGTISGLDASKLYEYRLESATEYTKVAAGSTQITGLAEGRYYVRFQAAGGKEASADAKVSLINPKVTVYLDQTNGSDDNDGYSEAAPVKTMDKAISQLAVQIADMPAGTAGTVVFLSDYEISAKIVTLPSHDFPVVLTSKDGTVGIKRTNNESYNRLAMGGDTTMENMTLTLNSSSTYCYLLASGHKLTIGQNVTTAGSKSFMLVGGEFKDTNRASADMTVMSGTWQNVYMGGYQGAISGDVSFTMLGGTVKNLIVPSYNKAISGDVTVVLENVEVGGALYLGNASAGNVAGDVSLTLGEGVKLASFYAGSRDAGNIGGTVTVTVDGADLTGVHLYGKAKNATGTCEKSVLVYKSGTLGEYSDFTEFVDQSAVEPDVIRGDLNGDGSVSDADAMYLLRYTLFGEGRYPMNQSGDVDGDGTVSDADAMYLLRFTLFGPSRYPLH